MMQKMRAFTNPKLDPAKANKVFRQIFHVHTMTYCYSTNCVLTNMELREIQTKEETPLHL